VVSRTGLATWLTVQNGADGDIAVYDVVQKRAVTLTDTFGQGDRAPRGFVDVNNDRVVWSDARLGSFDVWESFVVH